LIEFNHVYTQSVLLQERWGSTEGATRQRFERGGGTDAARQTETGGGSQNLAYAGWVPGIMGLMDSRYK